MTEHPLFEVGRLSALVATFAMEDKLAVIQAIKSLPAPLLDIMYSGDLKLAAARFDALPSRAALAWKAAGAGAPKPALCHLQARDEIAVQPGPGLATALAHEVIRAALQGLPPSSLSNLFHSVAAEGAALVAAAQAHVAKGAKASLFSDLSWCGTALSKSVAHAKAHKEPLGPLYIRAFDALDGKHLGAATEKLGRLQGLSGRPATGAAVFAHYMTRSGPIDPLSHIVREVLCYRYEADPFTIAPTLQAVTERLTRLRRGTAFHEGMEAPEEATPKSRRPQRAADNPYDSLPGASRRRMMTPAA